MHCTVVQYVGRSVTSTVLVLLLCTVQDVPCIIVFISI